MTHIGAHKGMTAAELMNMKISKHNFIVQTLLTEGLNVLGATKGQGKSFMTLDVAIAIAEAGLLWKAFRASEGDVLFLALEDTMERLKRRLEMRGGSSSERITFIAMGGWNRLDEGGLTALDEWMQEKPKTKLIVLDTLGRVADVGGSYDATTSTYGMLSRFGHAHHVAILATHHLTKKGSRDPFLSFLGSTGIGGAADTLLALKRPRFNADAVLAVTGKDVEEMELAVRFDRHCGTWSVIGSASDICLTDERQIVRDIIADHGQPLTCDDIRLALAKKGVVKRPGAVRVLLTRMVVSGEVGRAGRGRYVVEREKLQLLPTLHGRDGTAETCNDGNKGAAPSSAGDTQADPPPQSLTHPSESDAQPASGTTSQSPLDGHPAGGEITGSAPPSIPAPGSAASAMSTAGTAADHLHDDRALAGNGMAEAMAPARSNATIASPSPSIQAVEADTATDAPSPDPRTLVTTQESASDEGVAARASALVTTPPPAMDRAMVRALHLALHGFEDANERWQALRERGASDQQLQHAIACEFGLGGGGLGYEFKSGKNPRIRLATGQTLKGKALLRAARGLLRIPHFGVSTSRTRRPSRRKM
jgi:hypothetical protein